MSENESRPAGNRAANEQLDVLAENGSHHTPDGTAKASTLHAVPDDAEQVEATYNSTLHDITEAYLAGLDPDHLPSPARIESELLQRVNNAVVGSNVEHGRKGAGAWRQLTVLTPQQVAEVIARFHKVVAICPERDTQDTNDVVAVYVDHGPDEGIYTAKGQLLQKLVARYNFSADKRYTEEVMARLRTLIPRRTQEVDPNLVAVDNGIFNYETKELLPFTPDRVFISKVRTRYVPDAPNPTITRDDGSTWDVEDWVSGLSDDPEVVQLLWQVIGACVRPNIRWNQAAFLYSESGRNGKGTLCELIRQVVGPTGCASIPLSDLGKDFLLEGLTWSSCIVVDENDVGGFLDKAANFKAIVTNDVFQMNRKFEKPVTFQFHGFMVQCVNSMPRFKDKTSSLYRRQLMIPFTKRFGGNSVMAEYPDIKADFITRAEVREYVLWKVLDGMEDYWELDEPKVCRDLLDEAKAVNDPIRDFWIGHMDRFKWDLLPTSFLYALYRKWMDWANPGGAPVSLNAFGRTIRTIVNEDWSHVWEAPADPVRSAGLMDAPEPMIGEYRLESWYNPGYNGSDWDAIGTITPKVMYRGLVRKPNPAAQRALATAQQTDDDDTDTSDPATE